MSARSSSNLLLPALVVLMAAGLCVGQYELNLGREAPPAIQTASLSKEQRIFGLATIYGEAKHHFAEFERVPDLNWDQAFIAWLPLVEKEQTRYDYYRTLQRFTALLRDGHAGVDLPFDLQEKRDDLPFLIDFVGGEYVVTERMPSDDILEDDLPPGSTVMSVEGVPFDEWLKANLFPYVSVPSTHSKQLAFNWMHCFPKGADVPLVFRYPDGTTHSRSIIASRSSIRWNDDFRLRFHRAWTREPNFRIEQMEPDILYVRYGECTPKVQTAFCAAVKSLHQPQPRTMILDLRSNPGGDTAENSIGHLIQQRLSDPIIIRTRCSISCVDATLALLRNAGMKEEMIAQTVKQAVERGILPKGYSPGWFNTDTTLDPSADAYKGKLVILTDGDTASAAEEFVAILQASGRAIVVGENTNGSTGTPYFFDLPGGGRVRISTLNTRYRNGNTFKGAGIEPNVRVERTIRGIADGRDEVLKAALDYVHSLKT